MEKQKTSAYYQNRAVHCLAPAQSATVHSPHNNNNNNNNVNDQDKPFSVISEFDTWRKHPDLAEAVAAVGALAAVIRSSKASTMMQVEIQLKNASDTLNFARLYPLDQKDLAPALCPVDFGVPIPSKVKAPVERKIPNFSKYRLFSGERVKTLNPALLGGGKSHRF